MCALANPVRRLARSDRSGGPILLVLTTAVVLLVVSCRTTEQGSTPSEPTTTTVVATPEPPTSTSPPTTTTTDGVRFPNPGEAWDVLFISESDYPVTDTITELYTAAAEAALGVEVRTHRALVVQHAWEVLRQVKDEAHPGAGELVRQAEIIVLSTWPERSDGGTPDRIDKDSKNCRRYASVVNPKAPDPAVLRTTEYWEPYRVLLDEIFTEIWSLREKTPTLIVAIDTHQSYLGLTRKAGIEDECTVWFDEWSGVMRRVTEEHGGRFVSIFDVLNGPNHDLDPVELGWVGPSDQQPTIPSASPNEVGSEMIAEALAAVGFEPATPPKN